MPYRSNADLPLPLRRRLPGHAQDIYRAAFNNACAASRNAPDCEQRAHRIAWGAVKRTYVKFGAHWIPRSRLAFSSLSLH